MNSERIAQLQSFLRDTPGDPFLVYALALEFQQEDPAEAIRLFTGLLENHPEYLPTYYHAAALFDHLGNQEKAGAIYEAGIALARRQNASLALRELQSAYAEFQFGNED